MTVEATRIERVAFAVSAVAVAVPGARLLLDTTGYANAKSSLPLTPDVYSELSALGAVFVATAALLFTTATTRHFRGPSVAAGLIVFLPQGVARVVSYWLNAGQDESYLRAGIIEVVLGIAFVVIAAQTLRRNATHQ